MLDKISQDLKTAMKQKDKERLNTIRLIKSALINERIKLGKDALTDDDELTVISREVKQRRESIDEYAKANRMDLAGKEEIQLHILKDYLPKQLEEEEIRVLVGNVCQKQKATSIKDIGKVMGVITKEVKGKADMGFVS